MTTTKQGAFDWDAIRGTLGRPEVVGTLLGATPQLTRPLIGMTGGLGLFGAIDMLRNRGQNFGAFFRGPLAGRPGVRPWLPTATPGSPPVVAKGAPAPAAAPGFPPPELPAPAARLFRPPAGGGL